jgi:DNA-directed RNA polymerase subunit RPC12/RpoP
METAFVCPKCGKETDCTDLKTGDTGVCKHCGTEFEMVMEDSTSDQAGGLDRQAAVTGSVNHEQKYHMLRFIAGCCRFAAWGGVVLAGIGIAVALDAAKKTGSGAGIPVVYLLCAIPIVVSWFIFYLAIAEVVMLFIDIEQNTRNIKELVSSRGSEG